MGKLEDFYKTKYINKPGRYGTLYLYRYEYKDPNDIGYPQTASNVWAYDASHAVEKIHDGFLFQGFDGFEVVKDTLRRCEER